MARLPYLDVTDLAPEHQHLLKRNINLLRLMSHSPNGATAFHAMGQYIRHESPLNPRLREMAILQIGYVTRSVYEYTHHIKISRDFGVTDEDIRAIAAETKGQKTQLDPLTQTVLRAARSIFRLIRHKQLHRPEIPLRFPTEEVHLHYRHLPTPTGKV